MTDRRARNITVATSTGIGLMTLGVMLPTLTGSDVASSGLVTLGAITTFGSMMTLVVTVLRDEYRSE